MRPRARSARSSPGSSGRPRPPSRCWFTCARPTSARRSSGSTASGETVVVAERGLRGKQPLGAPPQPPGPRRRGQAVPGMGTRRRPLVQPVPVPEDHGDRPPVRLVGGTGAHLRSRTPITTSRKTQTRRSRAGRGPACTAASGLRGVTGRRAWAEARTADRRGGLAFAECVQIRARTVDLAWLASGEPPLGETVKKPVGGRSARFSLQVRVQAWPDAAPERTAIDELAAG